jgi:putative flippase GtrA
LASRAAFGAWLTQLAKFGTIGAAAYVVDAGGFNLLTIGPGHLMAAEPVRASLISGAVSILVAWIGNRYWTFSANRNERKTKELIQFVLVNIGGVLIASACLYISRWILDFHSVLSDNLARNIIGVGLGTIFRYLCYKLWVFTGPGKPNLPGRTG